MRDEPTGQTADRIERGELVIRDRGRTWRRRAPAGLALAILAIVPLGTGAGADPTFVTGSGRARANLFEIIPRTGGLEIPINFGKALATYQGLSATATSGGVKPPSQKSAGGDCGGAQPPGGGGGKGPLPAPPKPGGGNGPSTTMPFASTLSISTGDPDADKGRSIDQGSFPTGSPITGHMEHQQVYATAAPSARATTTSMSLALGNILEVLNGRTDADVGIVEGNARVAHAVTTIDRLSLFGNFVALVDVRWEATQRTGEGAKADGTFTVGKVILNNTELPALPTGPPPNDGKGPTLPDPLGALNTALTPTGISIVVPHLETAGGVARVVPMSIRFADSALGRALLAPLVTSLQPVRDPVVNGLLAYSCDFGTAVTVADVATSVLTGSGGISFDVGGVTATTEGELYDNPFAGGPGDDTGLGDGGGFANNDDVPGLPDLGAEPATDRSALSGPLADIGTGGATPIDFGGSGGTGLTGPSTAGAGVGTGGGTAPAGDEFAFGDPGVFGPASRHVPGQRGGRALAVAALALLLVAALAAADAFHLRRASRSIS